MKRRKFGLLSGMSIVALTAGNRSAFAQSSNFAELSKTTLTPLGSERAGNAAGTIPAWTGGMTDAGGWNPATEMVPDFFAGEQPLYVVDSSNMQQYASALSQGTQHLIQNGLVLKVYPTHRTAAAPQWIYDNIVANSTRAQLDLGGGRLGFTGGVGGGIPFPVPDTSDPLAAGAQIMWNFSCRWQLYYLRQNVASYISSGGIISLASAGYESLYYPYYDQNDSAARNSGYWEKFNTKTFAPTYLDGGEYLSWVSYNPIDQPNITWSLLTGQGRVRKAPEMSHDTPVANSGGFANFDELDGFYGALDEYDWKYIEKTELLVPYNNNGMRHASALEVHQPKFLNPDFVRWELHRVWVVEATLHPGQRNVLARRRFYIDEDTWSILLCDNFDAQGNLVHIVQVFSIVYPNLPTTMYLNSVVYDLEANGYTTTAGPWGNPPFNKLENFDPIDPSSFEPQTLAAASSF